MPNDTQDTSSQGQNNHPRSISDYIPEHIRQSARNAAQPITAPAEKRAEINDASILGNGRITFYIPAGSKHSVPTYVSNEGRYTVKPEYTTDANGKKSAYPTSVLITGDNGQYNKHYNERNTGASVNVMWPLAKVGENGIIEGGATLGAFRNSYYEQSTYLAGGIAYRHSEMIASALGKTSAAVGIELGRVTGYEGHKRHPNFGGQIYGELSQDITKSLSVSLKLGVMPDKFSVAHPEANHGQHVALKPGSEGVHYNPDGSTTYSFAKPLHTPVEQKRGVVGTAQVGVSWRF